MTDGDREVSWDRRPVPDPTLLTTQQLEREISGLRALLEQRIEERHELYQAELAGLSRVNAEKFSKVEQQFELVERQRVEQKADTKTAVDAALSAQKEAVKEQTTASGLAIAKSETGTTKQLEQLADNFKVAIAGIVTSIDDLKDRVGRIENRTQVVQETRSEGRLTMTQFITGGVLLVAVLALLVSAKII